MKGRSVVYDIYYSYGVEGHCEGLVLFDSHRLARVYLPVTMSICVLCEPCRDRPFPVPLSRSQIFVLWPSVVPLRFYPPDAFQGWKVPFSSPSLHSSTFPPAPFGVRESVVGSRPCRLPTVPLAMRRKWMLWLCFGWCVGRLCFSRSSLPNPELVCSYF